jgi:ATP-dependent RNA helicase DeaD
MLGAIEKATRQKITMMELPSTELINDKRIARFKQRISDTLANEDLAFFSQLVEQYQQEHNVPALEIAAALACMLQGDTPLLLQQKSPARTDRMREKDEKQIRKNSAGKEHTRSSRKEAPVEQGMERFRIEVGHKHGVRPGNIVGAIANEADIESQYIGRINIHDDYSLVDLPEGMPREIFNDLKKVRVAGQQLRISRLAKDKKQARSSRRPDDKSKRKGRPKDKHKAKTRSKKKEGKTSTRKGAAQT